MHYINTQYLFFLFFFFFFFGGGGGRGVAYSFMGKGNSCIFIHLCIHNTVGCPEEQCEQTHRSARHMRLKSSPTSTYRQFIICMFYLSKFHTKQDISCNLIYTDNWIFISLTVFYNFSFLLGTCVHVLLPITRRYIKSAGVIYLFYILT